MKFTLPSPILFVLDQLNRAGYEAYVVGGCVRDSLLGNIPLDWDVTTSALPLQTIEVFQDCRKLDNGIKHGTVTVFVEDIPVEITTYRVDGDYSDHRRPDSVSFSSSLNEDLKRRDFTINAMAYHPKYGLIDPYDGQNDLQKRIIRCVGDPQKRFGEDALRILRAIRFSSVLGFDIHKDTEAAIHQLRTTLTKVAIERVQVELRKWLCGKPDKTLLIYRDVLSVILPMINWHNVEIPPLDTAENSTEIRLSLLLYNCSLESILSALQHLRMSNQTTKFIHSIAECKGWSIHNDKALLLLLNRLGSEAANRYLEIRSSIENVEFAQRRLKELIEENKCYSIKQLAVSGEDLLRSGIPAGPAVGETLQRLLMLVIDEQCKNHKKELLLHI